MSLTELYFYSKSMIPQVSDENFLREALVKMNEFSFGFCIVANQEDEVTGVFTDGDLRRHLVDLNLNFSAFMLTEMKNIVTNQFYYVEKNNKEIFEIVKKHKVNEIPLLNEKKQLLGLFKMWNLGV